MANTELQFEMAMRDQIIYNQQETQRNMWNVLMGLGLEEKQILEAASKQGILIEDATMTSYPGLSDSKQSQNTGSYISLPYSPSSTQSVSKSSSIFKRTEDASGRSFSKENVHMPHTICREEHHSSYYYMTRDSSPSALMRPRKSNEHFLHDASPGSGTPYKYTRDFHDVQQHMRTMSSSYSGSPSQTSSLKSDFWQHQKVCNKNVICIMLLRKISGL